MIATEDRPWTRRFRSMRILQVLRSEQLTPQMRRITLGGPELVDLPSGPNVKLAIPPAGARTLAWPASGPAAIWPEGERPVVRTYTARRVDPVRGELVVAFVLHGEGPAAQWAMRAAPGDPIGLAGPGGRLVPPGTWYCLAGDHTALPAIAATLERLPPDARGHAIIAVPDKAEEQALVAPACMAITWLHADAPAGQGRQLEEAVRALPWLEREEISVWVGAESDTARALRDYVRGARGLDRRRFLIIGYWKRGMSETAYHARHDHDRGEDYHAVAREQQHVPAGTLPAAVPGAANHA